MKSCQLSIIRNLWLQFSNDLSEKLSSRIASIQGIEVSSQNKGVRAKILYVEPTGLLGITNEVVERLGSTGHSWVRLFQYHLVYLSNVKVSTKATWSYHFCVADYTYNMVVIYWNKTFPYKKKIWEEQYNLYQIVLRWCVMNLRRLIVNLVADNKNWMV